MIGIERYTYAAITSEMMPDAAWMIPKNSDQLATFSSVDIPTRINVVEVGFSASRVRPGLGRTTGMAIGLNEYGTLWSR
ncbi:hypothetical protein ACQP2F_05560 [Actinoplanes sp. CA-030573]|uniref:hypothetical protein n=1 Tax=Actinoplanes sp. CA-030573 TaxID=3239898 RepID=UPI003D8BD20A